VIPALPGVHGFAGMPDLPARLRWNCWGIDIQNKLILVSSTPGILMDDGE
jgi:hypothetical protein